jgi:hypothetical protein
MKFDHSVKYNGVYYRAGEEVPVVEKTEEAQANDNKSSGKSKTGAKSD